MLPPRHAIFLVPTLTWPRHACCAADDRADKVQFVREANLSEKQLFARSVAVSRKYSGKLLPAELLRMTTTLAQVYLVPELFVSALLLPMVLSFCNRLSFAAFIAKRATDHAQGGSSRQRRPWLAFRSKGWQERPNMTLALLSTSGANKSAVLADLQATVADVCKYRRVHNYIATDYTLEAVQALMGETDGTALLVLDEMKKIKATDEYKKNVGSGNEKLMELQSGQTFRVIRKGGARPSAHDEQSLSPETPGEASAVSVIEAQAHLNIAGTTHVHTGAAWFKNEQGMTDGKMTRFDCVAVEAQYSDLPDREEMEGLGISIDDGIDLFLLFNVLASLRDIFFFDANRKGILLLDPEAYAHFQEFIRNSVNPKLRELAREPQAGAQVSSLSKLKGKVLKFSGAVFLMMVAAEICALDEIREYDFDPDDDNDTNKFTAIIKATLIVKELVDKTKEGKIITKKALEFAILWGTMFHETGMALQHCMVRRTRLPPPLGGAESEAPTLSMTDDHSDSDSQYSNDADADRRPKHSLFDIPACWAAHAIITSKKFEAHMVSASYMTVDPSRLLIGNAATLTGGRVLSKNKPRPSFFAGAQQLVNDGLASWIYEGSNKSRLQLDKIWGVKLIDMAKMDSSVVEHVLAPYLITMEKFIQSCVPMSDRERSTYAHSDIKKFMRMPPPPPPAATLTAALTGAGASHNLNKDDELAVLTSPSADGGSATGSSPDENGSPSENAPRRSPRGHSSPKAPSAKKTRLNSVDAGSSGEAPREGTQMPAQLVPAAAGAKSQPSSIIGRIQDQFRAGLFS